ncbi:glycosyltransferase family 2 protein [Fundicoccus culcitae]|uniref:Glycosyltransferase family 2 protein n=1 Tax=Fundicoccus culcitae TaxID=2969821 RepID=A0ABY5P2F8_9LACT|nr:glycosyltransferase family 2 protein [Fundicoccus culcitae]UUX32800.1 glycosyltransferase family 2 protein [Fundicoccus culcitae]
MPVQDRITLVVPCYNEEETVSIFTEAIMEVQDQLPEAFLEIIFINDGSKDKTLANIKTLQAQYPDRVYYLSFSRNFGKEAGLMAGLEYAQGDYVAIMDVDLQDPPAMLIEMYHKIKHEPYDVVATRRVNRDGEPPVRSFFARMYYRLNNSISDVKLEEGARDYRLMTRQVVDAVLSLPESNRFSKGIFSWVGFDVAYLEYENVERSAGNTSWSFTQLFNYAIEGLISFSDAPLTIASYVGLFTFLFAVIYGIYIIVKTLIFGDSTPGWPSLAVLVVGMGGLQLLSLGIVGKYIAKIFNETKHRPLYIIKESKLPDSNPQAK